MKKEKKPGLADSSRFEAVIEQATSANVKFDPNGSYTGKPGEIFETPTQDADDL